MGLVVSNISLTRRGPSAMNSPSFCLCLRISSECISLILVFDIIVRLFLLRTAMPDCVCETKVGFFMQMSNELFCVTLSLWYLCTNEIRAKLLQILVLAGGKSCVCLLQRESFYSRGSISAGTR